MRSIPCEPVSPLSNPTSINLTSSIAVPVTARYILRVTATAGGWQLTARSGMSNLVQNEGANAFDVVPIGGAYFQLAPGQEAMLTWDSAQNKHEVQIQPIGGSTTVDPTLNIGSNNPVRNSAITAAINAIVAPVTVATIAALRALTTTPATVDILGHTTAGDGGEGRFRLLSASGNTAGDIDASGHDDNGWHIVCPATGAMYGRVSDVATPEHFGAVGSADVTAAVAASDQSARVNRWAKLWGNPASFPGAIVRGLAKWSRPRFEATARFYRCDATIDITVPDGSPNWYGGVIPTEMDWVGSTFKLVTSNFPSFRVRIGRNAGKSKVQLRYYKQLTGGNKVGWNATTYPQKYRDPAVYRSWAASTEVYRDEEIKHTTSGVTYLYRVTVSGTTGASAPTTSTSAQTNGTATLQNIGTITTSDGKWMRDHICETRDIGVWVDQLDTFHELYIDGENCAIGILECPRGGNTNFVGFCGIKAKYLLGCKWGIVTANHLFDFQVANSAARLALTGVPALSVVRETADATNDWVFTGAPGTESNTASWTSRPSRGNNWGWTNDIDHDVNLIYGRGNLVIDNTQSVYGIVSTAFGVDGSGNVTPPSGNWYEKIGVEFSNPSPATNVEMVQALIDSGIEHEIFCRNDNELSGSAAIFLNHVNHFETPRYNTVRTLRTGRRLNSYAWQNDRNNGGLNLVQQVPYMAERAIEFCVPDLFADAIFSGRDRIYFRSTATWKVNQTAPQDYADYRSATFPNSPIFNASDRSFDVRYQDSFATVCELPINHTGQAFLEIIPFFAPNSINLADLTQASRYTISFFNPTTGSGFVNPASWPVSLCRGTGQFANFSSGSMHYTWPQSDRVDPQIVGLPAWARKVLIRIHGEHLRGFCIRLHNAPGGSLYAANQANGRTIPFIAAKPERGIWKVPTRLVYASPSTVIAQLNKTAGATEYWATSGTVAGLAGSEVAYQWAHDGSGGVFERAADNSAWVQIASGVSAIVPADWQDI